MKRHINNRATLSPFGTGNARERAESLFDTSKMNNIAIIVLAAGKGTRMKSDLPKVLHKAAGRSLLGHVLHAARELSPNRAVVICGPDMEDVATEARSVFPDVAIAVQTERKGTAHAVSMARDALSGFSGTVLILYGDVPLIEASSLEDLEGAVTPENPLAVLGFEAEASAYARARWSKQKKLEPSW